MPTTGPNVSTITNAVHLPKLSASEIVASAQTSRLPVALLPTFLHEYAHHLCLRTVVGSVWSRLEIAAITEFREAIDPQEWTLPPTALRLRMLDHLLHPILEGFALFAEHDVYPGSSTIASPLVMWAGFLFRPEIHATAQLSPQDVDALIGRLLCTHRQTPTWVDRKAHLLLQPLDVSHGGYLAGYLTLKNLWQVARTRAPKLTDTSLFLAYTAMLIFEDHALAELLLDDTIDELTRTMSVRDRIQARFALFGQSDLDARVAQYEDVVANATDQEGVLNGHYETIFLDQETVERSRAAILDWSQRHTPAPTSVAQATADPLGFALAAVLLHREYMRLAIADATVEVTTGHHVTATVDGMTVLDQPVDASLQPGIDAGQLFLYFDSRSYRTILICTRGGDVVFADGPDAISVEEHKRMAFIIRVTLASESGLSDALDDINKQFDEPTSDALPFDAAVGATANELFRRYALGFVDVKHHDTTATAMARDGFGAIVDREPDLARALALIGLMSSCRRRNSDGPGMFQAHGLDYGASRQRLLEASHKWGFPLVTVGLGPDPAADPQGHIVGMV